MLINVSKIMYLFEDDIRPLTISSVWFLSTKYVKLSKVYTNEGGMVNLFHGLSACTENNPRPTAL